MKFSALAVLGIFFFGSVEGSDGALKSTQFGSPEHDENFMEAADSSYSHRQMGVTIAASACVEEDACGGQGNTVTIGDNSCIGVQACFHLGRNNPTVVDTEGVIVGSGSCTGHRACFQTGYFNPQGITVGDNSCTGHGACMKMGFIAPQGITVGDNSCTGEFACRFVENVDPTPPLAEIIIGAGSCNCENCCRCLSDGDIVADRKCNSLGNGAEECCLNEQWGNIRNTVFDFSNAGGAAVTGVGGEPEVSPLETLRCHPKS